MSEQSPRVPGDRSLDRSSELAKRAREIIPGGAQTGSKGPTQWVGDVSPTHIQRGEGCHVWDVDGNEYVDYTMALGPVTLGWDYPPVTEAVASQIRDGTTFSMPHPLQVDVAEQFVDLVPCAEMVRFAKNGNDVTTLAAKLARAYTGKDIIATQGYHGWTDVWMCDTPFDRGIPSAVGDYTESFAYNDIESLERIFEEHPGDVAGIVTTAANLDRPEDGFLERIREIADRENAVLVFDEILTGFRFHLGGAQEYFGVTPDLACFAKGMANGYPVSALAGRADVMRVMEDDDFMFSMTYAGEALSLAAAKATIDVLRSEDVIDHIHEVGAQIREGYNELAASYGLAGRTESHGFAGRIGTSFFTPDGESDTLAKSLFMQECHDRGVLFCGNHLPSYSHTQSDVEFTLDVYEDAMAELADAVEADEVKTRLRGRPVGATLRQQTGED